MMKIIMIIILENIIFFFRGILKFRMIYEIKLILYLCNICIVIIYVIFIGIIDFYFNVLIFWIYLDLKLLYKKL